MYVTETRANICGQTCLWTYACDYSMSWMLRSVEIERLVIVRICWIVVIVDRNWSLYDT